MKIGILTQPLHNNYGGLLQNYALQTVLKRMGHEVWTIDRNSNYPMWRRYASIAKRGMIKIATGNKNMALRAWQTQKEQNIISQNTLQFVRENIRTTQKVTTTNQLTALQKEYNFDAYIVGSDQVWRPKYSPCLSNYFLDFLKNNSSVKKIAYAASFGVNNWEFTEKQINKCAQLAKQFDAISVREDSAIDLCKRYFDLDALHLLDPTMLLNKVDYISLAENRNMKKSEGDLFTYILDKSSEKSQIIESIARDYNMKAFSVMPIKFSEPDKNINDCIFPPVENWIRGFMDAGFVITDSFHGTVFSILLKKPFISIANKDRGVPRFVSLLKLFQLEERLIYSSKDFIPDNLKEIDWEKIDIILQNERQSSIRFLIKNLRV